jgi:hypothetical protein
MVTNGKYQYIEPTYKWGEEISGDWMKEISGDWMKNGRTKHDTVYERKIGKKT